jgi:hypothetical protein
MFGLVHAYELPGRNTCQIDRKAVQGGADVARL